MASLTLVGAQAPDFALRDLNGELLRSGDLIGKIALLVFWSAECPHAERLDRILMRMAPGWPDEVVVWRIASAADEPEGRLASRAAELGVAPVLLDPDQTIADAFAAQVTPHVVVLDRQGVIRYFGAHDDVTFRQRQPQRSYLADAVGALLRGEQPDPSEVPAFGCALTRRRPVPGF